MRDNEMAAFVGIVRGIGIGAVGWVLILAWVLR